MTAAGPAESEIAQRSYDAGGVASKYLDSFIKAYHYRRSQARDTAECSLVAPAKEFFMFSVIGKPKNNWICRMSI